MNQRGALAGLRVIESGTMLAAPMCGMMLADHGADVVKLELPGDGDGMRAWGHHKDGVPLMWKMVGRNKRSVTLDLRKSRGRELFLRLLSTADIYIENFRPGTLDRWDLGIDVLRKAKPDLIVLRVSGYGQTGPRSARPGFGTLAEAMSGFAYINGWGNTPPTLPPFGLADSIAGITGAFGVLAALEHRRKTGEGQEIDVALYEPMMTVMGSLVVDYQQMGIVQERTGNTIPFTAPRNAYPTRDGRWIAVSCSTQATAVRLLTAIGQPELLQEERFRDNQRRVKNAVALDEYIIAWTKAHDYDEAMTIFERDGVTAGPVHSAADIVNDDHIRARGSLTEIDDIDLGPLVMQTPVPKMTGTPGSIAFAGRRTPGEDNASVYEAELGLSAAEIEELKAEGAI